MFGQVGDLPHAVASGSCVILAFPALALLDCGSPWQGEGVPALAGRRSWFEACRLAAAAVGPQRYVLAAAGFEHRGDAVGVAVDFLLPERGAGLLVVGADGAVG